MLSEREPPSSARVIPLRSSGSCSTSCPRSCRRRSSPTPRGPAGGPIPTSGWPSSATACSPSRVTSHLYPRLEADRFGPGRLTKIRAQAVSGRSCRVGGRASWGARSPARGRARLGGLGCPRAGGHRAGAGLGDRGGDRRLLPGLRLRAHGRGGRGGVRARDRGRARAPGRLQVRRCRNGWPARARWSPTTSSRRRGRRTTGCSRSARRSAASRSAAAAVGARRTPSRRPRRWPWRLWSEHRHVSEVDRPQRASSRSPTAPGSSSARA